VNEPRNRILRIRDNDELLRAMSPAQRREFHHQIRRLDEMAEHWAWIDELEGDLELALAAAAEGVFNWPQREPHSLTYDIATDLGTLRCAAQEAPPGEGLHVVTFADLEVAQNRLMQELADYYDTHDAVTGRRFEKETHA
jgi:hypothetical protein